MKNNLLSAWLLGLALLVLFSSQISAQGCDLVIDAGPDKYTCDPNQPVQLDGSINSNFPPDFVWVSTTGLNNPKILDPIVKRVPGKYKYKLTGNSMSGNLIINGDFEAGPVGYTTDYNFVQPSRYLARRTYGISDDPTPYDSTFPNCTGNGNFFIAKSGDPGDIVWSQSVACSPGETFLFKFRCQRFYKINPGGGSALVTLQAEVDGEVIGRTAYIPRCNWVEFSTCFVSKSSNMNLVIRETAGTNTGFGLDDISLVEKCMAEDEVEIEVVDLKSKIDLRPNPICGSQEFFLEGSANMNNPNVKYYWSTDMGVILQNLGKIILAKGNGTYKLLVVYDNGFAHCEHESEVTIDVPDNLEGLMEIFGKPNCQKDTFDLNGIGLNGTGTYKYIWGPANKIVAGQGTPNAKAISPGKYTLRIIDENTKCEFTTTEEVFGDGTLPTILITGDTLLNCLKNNASLESFPNDTSLIEWTWITPDQKLYRNISKMDIGTPGLVTLVVKDLKSKCQDSVFWNIHEDKILPKIELGSDLVIDCKDTEFTISASQEYQNGQFEYQWNLPKGVTKTEAQLRDKKITDAGKVILKVINLSNNCEAWDSISVNDIRSTPKITIDNVDELTCDYPELNIHANISANNQSINWSTKNGNIISTNNSHTIRVDRPGMYLIEVIDTINHCSIADSVEIFEYKTYPVVDLKSDTVFYCKDTDKTIDASGSSNSPNQKYIWTGNGVITGGLGTDKIVVSTAGTYQLTIIDTTSGCSDTKQITIKPDLNSPVAVISNPQTLTCKITSIQLNASASSATGNPLKYNWSSPQNFPIGNPNELNPVITNPGIYYLTVEDEVNGCATTTSVLINIDTISPVTAISNPEILNCKNTSIQLDASATSSSGNQLKYTWSSQQNFPIGNSTSLNPIITKPGNYVLFVEDETNGCSASSSVIVTIDTLTPVIDLGKNLIWNCATTDLNLDVINNTQGLNYSFQWSTNNGNIIGNSTQKSIKAGAPGVYRLIVIDQDNFCSNSSDIQILEDKAIPLAISSTADILTCVKKIAVLESSGSSTGSNISYVWKDLNGQIISTTQNATVNKIGKYILEVTDQLNKCTRTDTVEVLENIKNPIIDAGQQQELTCKKTETNLFANISAPGNNYSITWNTINGSIVNGSNGLSPKVNREGDYIITVTDLSNGCTSTDVVSVIKDNNVPTRIDYTVDQPKCIYDRGLVTVLSITGGKPNYSYFIDGKLVDIKNPLDVSVGNHQLKVIDDNGCELINAFNVTPPILTSIDLIPDVLLFEGDEFELKPIYSIPVDSIVSFDWTPAAFLDCSNCPYPKITGLQKENIFTVSITDKNGCVATAQIRIRIEERGIWVPNVFSPNGDGINDSFFPVVKEDSYKWIRYMRIFDRWGELVFQRDNFQPNTPVNGWKGNFKGETLNPAVFVWVLEVEWKNGDVEKLKGDVTLIK